MDGVPKGQKFFDKEFKVIIRRECPRCLGTGLQSSIPGVPPGLAIVCIYCEGSGEDIIEVSCAPFTGRKTFPVLERIKRVRLPEGHDPEHREVTYEEFLRGELQFTTPHTPRQVG